MIAVSKLPTLVIVISLRRSEEDCVMCLLPSCGSGSGQNAEPGTDVDAAVLQSPQAHFKSHVAVEHEQVHRSAPFQKIPGFADSQRAGEGGRVQRRFDVHAFVVGEVYDLADVRLGGAFQLDHLNGMIVNRFALQAAAQDIGEGGTAEHSHGEGGGRGQGLIPFGVPQEAQHYGRLQFVFGLIRQPAGRNQCRHCQ